MRRDVSKNSLNNGSEQMDNTGSILDTFAKVISNKRVTGMDPAKNLRTKFKIAMQKDDSLVDKFFQP